MWYVIMTVITYIVDPEGCDEMRRNGTMFPRVVPSCLDDGSGSWPAS